ncbi:MAG: DNA polymerase III subunit alpha [Alphaproteobacteria bacterium]|nr:DNA polymerase III subunit alpha [Alphaproteobacteria bacterium]MDX5367759.1 DNA polymerase III subunit alpha [Alphaproteobacteria bacterium]MDX5462642.1 DNA polymerase III subunit alpha [Alphaproteobacteria bacterium]
MTNGFIHLRVRTAYSLLEGAIPVKKLPGLCKAHGMPAVGVTDRNNLFGALEISETLSGEGVQPVIGCSLTLDAGVEEDRRAVRHGESRELALFVQNAVGYRNLLALMEAAYMDAGSGLGPSVGIERLEAHADGLIALTGGPFGPVGHALRHGGEGPAEALLLRLARAFPDRLYVELQRHGMPEEVAAEDFFVTRAYEHGLPLVATNDVYFPDAGLYEAHDALICIADGSYVVESDRRRLTPQHHFRTPAEMAAAFDDLPEAIANTVEIARRCAFRPRTHKPILPSFESDAGLDEGAELARQAREGLERRLSTVTPAAPRVEYDNRLAFELDIITRMGFPGYFLIVSDFIKWAKAHGIPVGPGRGSGAGSVVAWALTITDLDPLRFGLLFERFLNPERVSMPDFDIDFCQDRRDEVIRYVQGKYGHDRVAQIITFGKLQARAVLRDVGRVLQLPYGQVDRLCKLVPNNPANPVTLKEAVDGEERLREAQREDPQVKRMVDYAMKLEGLYRHASTHAAGVVIGDRPLSELVPLYRDPRSDMPVTQFNMKWVEPAGLVKFDFLGLKTLTVLAKALELLKRRGIVIDLETIPLDDPESYAMLARGESTGVFQLESSGMRDALRRLKPDCIEDIIALVALYRPGPMDNIPKYIACKQGDEEPDYLHPKLEPILKETYGVIIYQEQVMQIAQVLSGYSLGEADLLRRAMGKKIKEEMDKQKARFVSGAVDLGVDRGQADGIFDLVAKFAGYGFNKSHAAAYALVAYHTAYLKANYPVEFMAALMTLDMGNTDKLNLFKQELDRLSIPVLPPDVNHSEVEFVPQDGAVRYALGAIKNVGASAMQALVDQRRGNGQFRSVEDFARRLDPRLINKRALENLIRAGALDSLEGNRARLFHSADKLMGEAQRAAEERVSNQDSLFGGDEDATRLRLDSRPDWLPLDRLAEEFAAIGFYLSAHPLDDYQRALARARVLPYAEILRRAAQGAGRVTVAGTVIGRQERRSARGNKFAFVQLSDPSGVYEIAVFSEMLRDTRELLEVGKSVVISADTEVEGEQVRLRVLRVRAIDDILANDAAGLRVFLRDRDPLEHLKSRLPSPGRGRISLVLMLDDCAREVEIDLPGGYAVTPYTRGALKAVPGVVEVEDV